MIPFDYCFDFDCSVVVVAAASAAVVYQSKAVPLTMVVVHLERVALTLASMSLVVASIVLPLSVVRQRELTLLVAQRALPVVEQTWPVAAVVVVASTASSVVVPCSVLERPKLALVVPSAA